jgi:hypothetical protein
MCLAKVGIDPIPWEACDVLAGLLALGRMDIQELAG